MTDKKLIGEEGSMWEDPVLRIVVGDKTFDAVLSIKGQMEEPIAIPIRKKDITSLFLTCFATIKGHDLKISEEEMEEIVEFFS